MDDRKRRILQAIVEDYIETAQPVGSRSIARHHGLGVSPATVRNEMADLEEMGYVEQPHTSSGRIPSSQGYRYYVDHLMSVGLPQEADLEPIRRVYSDRVAPAQTLIRHTARLLSEVSQYTSVVVGPQLEKTSFRRLDLLPVDGNRLLMILLTGTGLVQTRLMDRPGGVSLAYLEGMVSSLNSNLAGMELDQLANRGLEKQRLDFPRGVAVFETLRGMIEQGQAADELFLVGTANILSQPEFRDVEKIRTLFSIFDQQRLFQDLLLQMNVGEEVMVTIGEENPHSEMHDCSLVTAAYYVGGRLCGRLGILGPRRMQYSRAVGLVAMVRELLSQELWRRLG